MSTHHDHNTALDPGPRHDRDIPPEIAAIADRAEAYALQQARDAADRERVRSDYRARYEWTAAYAYELALAELARQQEGHRA